MRRCNPAKKEADVLYIDYGNSETVPFSRLQPLSPQLKTLEPQSKEATLSFVTLLDSSTEYGPDALNLFKDLCEGQQLVANIDARENTLLHLSLFDPKNPSASMSHESSINVLLVREGLARIDMRSRFRGAYPAVVKALDEAVKEAKRSRYVDTACSDCIRFDVLMLMFPVLIGIGMEHMSWEISLRIKKT